ncbi:energy transducer TonB [Aeromonas tecta]|uniref:energy transducer TonB n=1 Tax=Aeromonas tecta TaxID=324617 RepID=UPI0006805ABF|nr:energy transducer TonB [Aeromonas tecta]
MDASALRPAACRNNVSFGPAQLVCLVAAIALHLTILWWVHSNRVDPIAPPEPITMSARWAGESNKDDAPAKPAAPAAVPTPPVVKKPTPVPPKVVKPVAKKPIPKPVPTPPKPKPRPVPVTKPAPVAKAEPVAPPSAPAAPQATANNQSASGASAPPTKSRQTGAGAGSSAPIARDARLNNPEPPYPQESRRRGEQGRVVLKVRVTKEGTAESVEVERSSGFRRLDMIARKTVSRWRFIPAKQNNVAVADWAGVTIIFKLGT